MSVELKNSSDCIILILKVNFFCFDFKFHVEDLQSRIKLRVSNQKYNNTNYI